MKLTLVKEFFWRTGGVAFSGENVPGQGGTARCHLKFPESYSGPRGVHGRLPDAAISTVFVGAGGLMLRNIQDWFTRK